MYEDPSPAEYCENESKPRGDVCGFMTKTPPEAAYEDYWWASAGRREAGT
jgi:hypothetical protein